MKNPTKQQMQTVINTMEIADKMAKKAGLGPINVNMMSFKIVHSCDTPNCFAGWYVVAKNLTEINYYLDGRAIIARDLGFEFGYNLEIWAHTNPIIWGNECGNAIFADGMAFGEKSDLISIRTIINHLKSVQKRLSN